MTSSPRRAGASWPPASAVGDRAAPAPPSRPGAPAVQIIIREVALQFHRAMEHPPDLDAAIGADPVQEEVTGLFRLPDRRVDMIAALPEVVRPRARSDLRSCLTPDAHGFVGNVEDGLDVERRSWREPESGRRVTRSPVHVRHDPPHARRSAG